MKKFIAEAIGTFALALTVGLSIVGVFPVPTAVLAALVLGLFVYSIGHISGAHVNPAVTIGAWSIGKIAVKDAILYIVFQFIGASVAYGVLSWVAQVPTLSVSNGWMVGLAELIGTFFFTFGIASVVYGRTPGNLSGVVVGGSLLLGIAIAMIIASNGILNPAVALTVGSFGVMYIIGPIIGSVLGMQVYKRLQ